MRKISYFLLCLPFIVFFVLCHYYPEYALNSFIALTFLHVILGLFFYNKNNVSATIFLIFLEGLALKLFYITYTPYTDRQHDTGEFKDEGRGHFQYIYYLLKNHTLPFFHQEPGYPIPHPPLHYILSALFLSVIPGYENLQYMTLLWSFGATVVSYLCLKLVIKKENYLLLAALFCSFFPAFIIYSGSLNNDILNTFLSMTAIFCFLLHLQSNKIKFLLLSAFFLGLAALAKISVITIYIGICSFYALSILMHQIKFKTAFKRLSLFSLICLPMILIYPIYNFIRWDGYSVFGAHLWGHFDSWSEALSFWFAGYNPFLHIEEVVFDPYQGVGTYSLLDRLGVIFEPLTKPYFLCGAYHSTIVSEYNIWLGLLKSSLFDEYRLFNYGASIISSIAFDLSVFLLVLSYLLLFFFILSFLKVSSKDPSILCCKSIIVTVMLGFIYWCLKNPLWSAVSFRYIAFLFPCFCFIVAKYVQGNLSASLKWGKKLKNILAITIFFFSWISLIIYTLLSV